MPSVPFLTCISEVPKANHETSLRAFERRRVTSKSPLRRVSETKTRELLGGEDLKETISSLKRGHVIDLPSTDRTD